MSEFEHEDDQGEELIAEEWPTFFTMVPVWLLLSGCSAQAYRMYAFLAEHINQRTPGKRIACPKQIAIARVLGLSSDRKVARYREELVKLGALRVEEYRYGGGMRRGYRYFVRFNPPAGFQGLTSLQAFYEDNPDVRSAKAEGRTRTAKTEAQGQVPSQARPDGGHGRGGAAADGATTSAAAKPKRAAGARGNVALPPEVLQVLSAFPQSLRDAMRETARTEAPKTLVTAVIKALQDRTAQQLVDRVARRWWLHGYEQKLEAGELARPVGAAVAILRHCDCPDPGCEDGELLAGGGPCQLCIERGKDYRANHARLRKAEKEAARHAARRAACPACERDRGTDGAVCGSCVTGFERAVAAAADRAAADLAASSTAPTEHAAQAREHVLEQAQRAREQARQDGAADLGQLLAARLAAESAAQEVRQLRLSARDDAPEEVGIPAQAAAPHAKLEPAPCSGSRWDGSPCDRVTTAEDGMCGPCRGIHLARTQELTSAP